MQIHNPDFRQYFPKIDFIRPLGNSEATNAKAKWAFKQFLFEANLLFKKEGLVKAKKPFFELAPLLVMKLMSESTTHRHSLLPLKFKPKLDWEHFSKLEPQSMLKMMNQVILPELVKAYNSHTLFFQQKSSIKNPETLKKLVDKLSTSNLSCLDSDILGDAFEYFLHQNALRNKQDLGIYFTPRHVVKLMIDLIKPKAGDQIYDPACGSGGFLTEAFKALKKPSQGLHKKSVFGREISDSIKIAKMNLLMAGADASTVCQMDTLQISIHNQFRVVLANFPFSQKTNHGHLYGFKGKDANPIFLKHIMDALKPNGIAGVIVPDRLLFNENPEYIKVRKLLLETCRVLAVIQLHEFVFMPYTKQPTSILLFKKGGETKKVWFFDVREDGFKKTTCIDGRPPIAENDLDLLRRLWKNKKNSSHSFFVAIPRIVKGNYHLSMNRYKKSNQSLKDRVNLGDICDILIGETPRKTNKHFYGGKNLFVRIKDLNQEIIKSTDVTLTDEGINQAKVKSLKKHTLLFSFKLTIAKVAFAGRKLYTCESIAGLIPKDNRVLAPYLYHILPKLDYSPYINRGAKGQELKRSVLKTIQIPLPPLPIQKKLVRKLTCQEAKRKHFLKQAEKIRQIKNTTIKGLLK